MGLKLKGEGQLEVTEIVPYGPVYQCGKIKLGDILRRVDGREVGKTLSSAKDLLLGDVGTWVALTFLRQETMFGLEAIRVERDFTVSVLRAHAPYGPPKSLAPSTNDYLSLPSADTDFRSRDQAGQAQEESLWNQLLEERSASQQLASKLQSLQQAYHILQEDCGLLLRGLEDARADAKSAAQRVDALERERERAGHECDALRAEAHDLRGALDQMLRKPARVAVPAADAGSLLREQQQAERLRAAEDELARARAEVERLAAELDAAQRDGGVLRATLAEYHGVVDSFGGGEDLPAARRQAAAAMAELEELRRECLRQSGEIGAAHAERAELAGRVRAAEGLAEAAECGRRAVEAVRTRSNRWARSASSSCRAQATPSRTSFWMDSMRSMRITTSMAKASGRIDRTRAE